MKAKIVVLLLMLTLVLTSCATTPAGGGSQAPAADSSETVDETAAGEEESAVENTPELKEGEVMITVLSVNDASKVFHKDIIPLFEAEHPGIRVQFIEVPFDQHDTKIQTMLASGSNLDLNSHNGWTGFGGRMANKQLLPLDDLMEKYGFTTADHNIPQEAVDVWKYEDQLYAIPVHIFPSFMLYNKDIFDEAGIGYPPATYDDPNWTWDAMIEIAHKLTKDLDDPVKAQYGLNFNWDAGGHEQMPQYFGHNSFDDATFTTGGIPAEAYFDTPEVIECYQNIIDLTYGENPVSPTSAISEAMGGNVFYAGKCAMYVDGGWVMAGTNDMPFRVGIAAIPNGGNDKVRGTMWIDPYWIFSTSKHPEEAFQYLAFMLRDDIQIKIVEASDGLAPANMNAFDSYTSFYKNVDAGDMKQVFDGGVKFGFEGFSHLMADSASLNTLITNEMDPMYKEGKPAAEVLPNVQKKIEEFIETTRSKYNK